VVTDSKVLTLGPKLAAHFVSAEVRTFPAAERDAAMTWLAPTDAAQTD
jgi:SpoIIAA-like